MAGHPTYHVNVIIEIIWTGGLPLLSGLPRLAGPSFHTGLYPFWRVLIERSFRTNFETGKGDY